MSYKTKYYIGACTEGVDRGKEDIFSVDNPKDATPEASGYDEVIAGPFDTY